MPMATDPAVLEAVAKALSLVEGDDEWQKLDEHTKRDFRFQADIAIEAYEAAKAAH